MRPFEIRGTVIVATLHEVESEMLCQLAGQLAELLGDRARTDRSDSPAGSAAALLAQLGIGGSASAPLDPALARLLPDAYRNDHTAASEHRQLTELGLVDRKIANAEAVVASLTNDPVELTDAIAQSWLRTLTDLRLTLAARLHIEDDGDEGTGDDAMLDVYDWLGYLQGTLLETIEHREVNGEL
ncbi:DUF2017 domain-containing protein [Salinibacterium sp. G-O1]|uniref:DUF2017 domain-containing protein n=1 Tax=Salinibacterium sp. G-O1 TaxID=3046208 RepID=UPI0024B934C8|nr:DUF2017 domain-containing protein [Salinibacterium sp. G-O1]MDJ0335574.1 DUF2017 domain-containing protein [Salinibacterium sp. G-O1]